MFENLLKSKKPEKRANISDKSHLKDKYLHDLENIMQALYLIEYIIENESKFEKIEDKLEMFKNKLDEASKLIGKIRKL